MFNKSEKETLILDCGIPIKEIKKGLNFDLSGSLRWLRTHKTDYDISVGEGLAPPENEREDFVWIGAESLIHKVSR